MPSSLYSPSWYRVENLKPRLRSHARIHRQLYRGQTWYVLQDLASERFHRFSRPAYEVIGLMDGNRTVQAIWDLASSRLGDDAPTQDQVIRLLTQLHMADALQMDILPDTSEFLKRYGKERRQRWLGIILNPLSWRFPLFDPEKVLVRFYPLVRPLFSWVGALLWLSIVGTAAVQAVLHWRDLTADVIDRVLEPSNLLLLWIVIPVLKIVHEFGHAFAVKRYGGEVHEIGVIFLVLTPLPYVDASAATALRNKWQRIFIGAAGVMVEVVLASFALFFWLNAEPGTLRSIAFDVVFIAGVSTVLFNANPLLRYDGYYVLCDFLEIPNLRVRANQYCGYLFERYLFGQKEAQKPLCTLGEKLWFLGYNVSSFFYRLFLSVAIIFFIATKFFFVGVLLALWAVVSWGVIPFCKGVIYVLRSPRLHRVRFRAVTVSASLLLALLGMLFLVPLPLRSRAEGVIWIPEQAIVRAGAEGFIERLVAAPGSRVKSGDPLIVTTDPVTETEARVLEGRLKELKARYDEQWVIDRVKAQILEDEMAHLRKSLARAHEKVEELTIRSPCDGTFVVPNPGDLPGAFVRQGASLAHVLELGKLTVRAIVAQGEIDLIRQRTRGILVRLSERLAVPYPATILREVPGAMGELPSTALAIGGGGKVPTDPSDARGVKTIQKFFQLDLELEAPSPLINIGGRVHLRFDQGWEPIFYRWHRELRQLFLRRFNV